MSCVAINPNVFCILIGILVLGLIGLFTPASRWLSESLKTTLMILYPMWIIVIIYLVHIGVYIPQGGEIPSICTSIMYIP